MAGRYDSWTHKRGGEGRPDLQSYALKLLGYLQDNMEAGGLTSQLIRRVLPDGSVVSAQLVNGMPIISIQAGDPPSSVIPVDLSGFVTWPTTAAGQTSLTSSPRVVLAGPDFTPVKQARYKQLFPSYRTNPADPASEITGLGRAGNVDWHGDKGWVLSWYGPRTRYLDNAPPLKPWVFFKGKQVFDAVVTAGAGAEVTGAAIHKASNGTWLIVVMNRFVSVARYEVWAVKVLSKPTDALMALSGAPVQIAVQTRSESDFQNHPWCFHPDGHEGRRLASASAGGLWERRITLTETADALLATFAHDVVPQITKLESAGYTSATYGMLLGKTTNTRIPPKDLNGVLPTSSTGMAAGATIVTSSSFNPVSSDSCYQASPQGMLSFDWARNITCSADWQRVAVDYLRDGTLVYAYGRSTNYAETRTGGMQATRTAVSAAINSAAITITSFADGAGGFTNHSGAYDNGSTRTSGQINFSSTMTWATDQTHFGIRLGAVDVLARNTVSGSGTGTMVTPITGLSTGADPRSHDTVAGILTRITGHVDGVGTTPATDLGTVLSETHHTENLYLQWMDLRYDMLFVVTRTEDRSDTTTTTLAFKDPIAGGTLTTVVSDSHDDVWRTKGWIKGVLVLDDPLVTRDENTGSTTNGAQSAHSSGNSNNYSYSCAYTAFVPGHSSVYAVVPKYIGYSGKIEQPATTAPSLTPVPVAYVAQVTAANNADDMYRLLFTQYPVIQVLTMSFPYQSEPAAGQIVGYTGASVGNVQTKWHIDADGVAIPGAWCSYKGRWLYSQCLPTIRNSTSFRFTSRCSSGSVFAKAQLVDPPTNHTYPVWVLAVTKGFRP